MSGSDDEVLLSLEDEDALEEALRRPLVVVYKHSPLCWLSFRAIGEVRRFALEAGDVPVFVIDVVGSRPFPRRVAERVGVRHESPQVMLVKQGEVVWHASHGSVRADNLRTAISAAE